MLAIAGCTATTAVAQSSANSKFAKNYPVCLVGGQYQICNSGMSSEIGRTTEVSSEGIRMETTYVHLGSSSGNARYRGNRIRVSYDEPDAPYEGKESMVNDGVQKNKHRNINTNNGAYDLPPNDGGR